MKQASCPSTALRFSPALSRLAGLALLAACSLAQAQSFCASDRLARPTALLERFINADCAECWSDTATPAAQRGALALDWVVPGSQGEDAALSSVASRDSITRLEALGKQAQAGQWHERKPVAGAKVTEKRRASAYRLRVSHGVVFNGYVGVSIELKPLPAQSPTRHDGPWTAWLALVESIPMGTEGTPVERQLVRNLLVVPWSRQQAGGIERRSMALPEGTNPERIGLVGWVEDSRGRVRAAVQSQCGER